MSCMGRSYQRREICCMARQFDMFPNLDKNEQTVL